MPNPITSQLDEKSANHVRAWSSWTVPDTASMDPNTDQKIKDAALRIDIFQQYLYGRVKCLTGIRNPEPKTQYAWKSTDEISQERLDHHLRQFSFGHSGDNQRIGNVIWKGIFVTFVSAEEAARARAVIAILGLDIVGPNP
jgi:hypothetical protein